MVDLSDYARVLFLLIKPPMPEGAAAFDTRGATALPLAGRAWAKRHGLIAAVAQQAEGLRATRAPHALIIRSRNACAVSAECQFLLPKFHANAHASRRASLTRLPTKPSHHRFYFHFTSRRILSTPEPPDIGGRMTSVTIIEGAAPLRRRAEIDAGIREFLRLKSRARKR